MGTEIPDTYIDNADLKDDLCDCAECQNDRLFESLVQPEDIYEFTASEFEELLDDIDLKSETARFWKLSSDDNASAAQTFASALEYIVGIEDPNAAPYVADFARSLFHFTDVDVHEDGTPVL